MFFSSLCLPSYPLQATDSYQQILVPSGSGQPSLGHPEAMCGTHSTPPPHPTPRSPASWAAHSQPASREGLACPREVPPVYSGATVLEGGRCPRLLVAASSVGGFRAVPDPALGRSGARASCLLSRCDCSCLALAIVVCGPGRGVG